MTHSERMQQFLHIGNKKVWEDGRIITYTGKQGITGAELASRLAHALEYRAKLDRCIHSMETILDEGETVDEWQLRIDTENADPATAAKAMGWFAIEDFAELCDASDTGFRKFISGCRGQIVKPVDEATFQRLLGTNWERYPPRSFYWGDYFRSAEDWTDALAKARKEQFA